MTIVKTIKVNNVSVNIHNDFIPKDEKEYKKNLKILYDNLNNKFSKKKNDSLFYSQKELEKLKKDKSIQFI